MSLPAENRRNLQLMVAEMPAEGSRYKPWMIRWLAEYTSPATKRNYERFVTDFFRWARCDVTEVSREMVLKYRAKLEKDGAAPTTRRCALMTLASFYGYLQRNWQGPAWPDLRKIRPEQIPDLRHERILTAKEVRALLAACEDHDRTLLRFIYETAARVNEACELKWSAVVPMQGGAVVSLFCKGGKMRLAPIGAELYRLLKQLPRTGELVFGTDQRTVRKIMQTAREKLVMEQPASPHWLRHARLSHLAALQVPVTELRDFAGHACIETTNFYLHSAGRLNNMPETLGEDGDD